MYAVIHQFHTFQPFSRRLPTFPRRYQISATVAVYRQAKRASPEHEGGRNPAEENKFKKTTTTDYPPPHHPSSQYKAVNEHSTYHKVDFN